MPTWPLVRSMRLWFREKTPLEVFFRTFRVWYYIVMLHPIVWIFLLLSSAFALLHSFAVQASLYWYYWWFDILMHFSGGVLITIGLHALGTFKRFNCKPKLKHVFWVTLAFVIVWEIFEYNAGLYEPGLAQWLDTGYDIFNGFAGAISAYFVIKKLRK